MTGTEGGGAEVHVLYRAPDEEDEKAPIHRQERRDWCAHKSVRLDEEAHRVYCRKCDREVDAFAVLRDLAGDWDRWVSSRKEAERRAKVAHANLQELLREERNAKSRKRRREK